SVSAAGDVNGDGIDDIIVGAPRTDLSGRTDVGVAFVIFGKKSGFVDLNTGSLTKPDSGGFIIYGVFPYDYFGISVSGAGDVNGDGIDDFIVGAPRANPTGGTDPVYFRGGRTDCGAAYVIYGKKSGVRNIDLKSFVFSNTTGFIIQGAAVGDFLGSSVSGAGDVNGDGKDDVIVGAILANPNSRSKAGAAYVIYGMFDRTGAVDLLGFVSGARGFIIQGAAAGDYLGWSVSGAGDVNGDTYADVIVGAPLADPNSRSDAGAAYLILGKASGFVTVDVASFTFDDSTGYIIQGAAARDQLGFSVSGAGDVNGDMHGTDDFIVGARYASPNGLPRAGAAYVILGMKSGFTTVDLASFSLDNSRGFSIKGAAAGGQLGYSVSGAGDINGDGINDVLVGAPYSGAGDIVGDGINDEGAASESRLVLPT
ncbi:hypothetical protein B484DRAFT_409969, partial [Ochromonadaceae sp. CCMP2298]